MSLAGQMTARSAMACALAGQTQRAVVLITPAALAANEAVTVHHGAATLPAAPQPLTGECVMAGPTLHLSVIDKRMLSETEAASYCGLPIKHFKAACPVLPVRLAPNALRFDKRDLDGWIDGEKAGASEASRESILARLG